METADDQKCEKWQPSSTCLTRYDTATTEVTVNSGTRYEAIHLMNVFSSGFPGGSVVKNLPAMQKLQKMQVQSLGGEDPLEEGMATHSSTVAWRIPCIEKSDGLLSMRSVDSYMTEWQTHTHSS